jgi:hypothetical protein
LRGLLEARVAALEPRLEELEKPVPGVPRLFLIEGEYMASMVRAEIRWLRAIIADLNSGRLTFPTEAELRRVSAEMGGPSDATIRRLKEGQVLSPSKRDSRGRAPKANRAAERRRKTR